MKGSLVISSNFCPLFTHLYSPLPFSIVTAFILKSESYLNPELKSMFQMRSIGVPVLGAKLISNFLAGVFPSNFILALPDKQSPPAPITNAGHRLSRDPVNKVPAMTIDQSRPKRKRGEGDKETIFGHLDRAS